MGFTNFPPSTGSDINSYAWFNQIWKAVQERAWSVGEVAWPPTNFRWATGTVSSLVNNNDGTYTATVSGATYATNRFAGYSNPSTPWVPRDYDFIIDTPFDETTCIHAKINSNTSNTFTITDVFADALTSNFLSSVSSLVGCTYYVIKRNGLWWSDRYLDYPNAFEAANGLSLTAGAIQKVTNLVASGTTATATVPNSGFQNGDSVTITGAVPSGYNGVKTITVIDANTFTYTVSSGSASPATGTITAWNQFTGANDATANYKPGLYASGYELMVNGSDGALKRITLTGNDKTNLFFARQTYTVSGQYGIVATGGKWRMYTHDCRPYSAAIYRWYDAADIGVSPVAPFITYYSRLPDDTIGAMKSPRPGITLNGGFDCSSTFTQTIFDTDFFTDSTDICNPPDQCYTPDIYRSIRQIQVSLETACQFFCEQKSYEGAQAIPNFVPATFFYAAGINSFSTTTGSLDDTGGVGGIDIGSIALPYTPINVYFAVLNSDGSVHSSGTGQCQTTTHLTKDVGSFNAFDPGKTCIISLGWTRQYRNSFLYMYPKRTWLPSYDGTHSTYVDPPTSSFPGTWNNRQVSSKYKEHDAIGIVNDANGRRTFVTNDFASYDGDNFWDPSIHPETLTTDSSALNGYYNAQYEGLLSPAHQATLVASMSGTVTSSTRFSLQDTTKNWWAGGVLHTETGTFNGGSTTDGSDSTKSGSGFWGNGSFGSSTWLQGHIVQVTISGVEYRRRISNYFGTLDMTWDDALPSSANGKAYVIRSPEYELNRWAARTLELTFPDGTVHTKTIDGNDDISLYFGNLGFDIPAGTTYRILESYPGGVWKWNGSKWIVPTGTDARGGQPWRYNQNYNLPTYNTDYGRFMVDDYVTPKLWTELYNAILTLAWVPWPMVWTSAGYTNQSAPPEAAGYAPSFGGLAAAQAQAESDFASGTYNTSTSGQPYCFAFTSTQCGGSSPACYSYAIGRRFAYGYCTNILTYENSVVDFYAYCLVPTNLDGHSSASDTNGSCTPIISYDDNGDGVLYQAFHQFASDSTVSGGSSLSSSPCGTNPLTHPNEVGPAPAPCPDDCSWWNGYVVTQQVAIVKWNISGGYVYQ